MATTRGTKRTSTAKRRRASSNTMNEDIGKGRSMAKRTRKSTSTAMKEEPVGRRGVRGRRIARTSTRVTGGRKGGRKTSRK